RFDELVTQPAAVRPVQRRVRPNAATANLARFSAAISARDTDALSTGLADDSEVLDHTTDTTWDREAQLRSLRYLLCARDPRCHCEPLATLADSLALCRVSMSASGAVGRTFDVGAYERDELHLIEVDAQGQRRCGEIFAIARLGDAIA